MGRNHARSAGRLGRDMGPMSGLLARRFTGKPGVQGPASGPGRGTFRGGYVRPAPSRRPRGSGGRPGNPFRSPNR